MGLVSGVTAGALMLRALLLTRKALWFDETFSVFLAGQPLVRLLPLVRANDPHPPLYYLLLHLWMGIFGDGEVAVRALSVLISAAIVPVTWAFGRRLLGSWPALLGAVIIAVAPSQVASGQEARMYGLLTLLSVASWWALWAGLETGRRGSWVAYALLTAASLYTQYYSFFIWGAQGAYLLWRRSNVATWRTWVVASIAALLLFLPWLPAFVDQVTSGRAWPAHRPELRWAAPLEVLLGMTIGGQIGQAVGLGGWTMQAVSIAAVPLAGAAAAAILSAAALRARSLGGIKALLVMAALLPLLAAFMLSLWLNVFSPRYLVFITPPIVLLLLAGLHTVSEIGRRWAKPAAAALMAAILLPNIMGLVAFYRKPRLDVFDWRLIAHTLAAEAGDDDAIVFLPGLSRIPINYYFRGPQLRLALTPEGADVAGEGGAKMDTVLVQLEQHPRIWILTIPPVPASVGTMVGRLQRKSYRMARQGRINMARIILLERRMEH